MPSIIRDLPFLDTNSVVEFRGRTRQVKADQIVLWVSVTEKAVSELPSTAPRIPAIFDTGCNHNFVIHERHLRDWAAISLQSLRSLGSVSVARRRVSQLAANIWLHPNRPGQRDEFAERPPFLLELPTGIAVVPAGGNEWPRLPLLGLRGLRRAGLHVSLDCGRGRLSLRTRRRFWIF